MYKANIPKVHSQLLTKHIVVEGKVQGVFFRDTTRSKAIHYCLTGWVKNLPNGSVETMIRGEEENITKMLLWLKKGTPPARVDRVIIDDIKPGENLPAFEIRY